MNMKKNRCFASFDDIDKELKILKLKKQINTLQMKNGFTQLKEDFTVPNLVISSVSSLGFSSLTSNKKWISKALEIGLLLLLRRRG